MKSPLDSLARFLYPSENDWHRRDEFKRMVWVVIVALIFGCVVGGFILFIAHRNRF